MIKSELGKGTCLPDKDLNCIDVPLEGPFTLIMPDGVEHSDMVLEQGMRLDMIDVTTMDDTERKFIMGFTGNPGTR